MQIVEGASHLMKGGSDGALFSARPGCLLLVVAIRSSRTESIWGGMGGRDAAGRILGDGDGARSSGLTERSPGPPCGSTGMYGHPCAWCGLTRTRGVTAWGLWRTPCPGPRPRRRSRAGRRRPEAPSAGCADACPGAGARQDDYNAACAYAVAMNGTEGGRGARSAESSPTWPWTNSRARHKPM